MDGMDGMDGRVWDRLIALVAKLLYEVQRSAAQ